MPKLIAFAAAAETWLNCFINRWWRPAGASCVVAALAVDCVYLPLVTLRPPNAAELGALVTGLAALFAVREWGKAQGASQ